jgi:integrase
MASLRKRRSKWYARVSLWDGYRQTHKQIPLYTESKVTARVRLEEVNRYEKDIKNGLEYSFAWLNADGRTKIQRITLESTIPQYIKYKMRMGLTKGSINRIKNSLNIFLKLYGHTFPIKSINQKHIDSFTDYCLNEYTPAGTNINLRNLKTFLKWLHDTEQITKLPILKMVKVEKSKPSYLTEKEFSLIINLDQLEPFYKNVFKFHVGTGCRLSEPYYGNIQGDYLVIPAKYTKAKLEKEVFLSNDLKNIWVEMIEFKDEWIQRGNKFPNLPLSISKKFLWACRKVSIDHHFHDLRHTFAVIRYLLTGNIYSVKKDLGHSSVTTTEIYADFKTSRLLVDFPSLKKLIKKRQNMAKIPIMDTDSMDTRALLSSE